jgi:hypothetical protein
MNRIHLRSRRRRADTPKGTLNRAFASYATVLAVAASLGVSFLYVACGGDDDTVKESVTPDAGPTTTNDSGGPSGSDAGPDGAADDCVQNPVTYLEIINACTGPGVTKIEKNPSLDKLLPDGGLPPVN